MKEKPLTTDEVKKYGEGFINKGLNNAGNPKDFNGYAAVAYYSSDNCNFFNYSECTNNYNDSDIKHILDNWISNNISINGIDSSTLNPRVISKSDLISMNYVSISKYYPEGTSGTYIYYEPQYNSYIDLSYCWTNFADNDSVNNIIAVDARNGFMHKYVYEDSGLICPVINLKKTVPQNDIIVEVPDTKLSKGIMIILSGVVIIGLSIVLSIMNQRDKKGNRQ